MVPSASRPFQAAPLPGVYWLMYSHYLRAVQVSSLQVTFWDHYPCLYSYNTQCLLFIILFCYLSIKFPLGPGLCLIQFCILSSCHIVWHRNLIYLCWQTMVRTDFLTSNSVLFKINVSCSGKGFFYNTDYPKDEKTVANTL